MAMTLNMIQNADDTITQILLSAKVHKNNIKTTDFNKKSYENNNLSNF